MACKVLIVEPEGIIREGLTLLINSFPEMSVIASVGCAEDAIRSALELNPDIVITEMALPKTSGLELIQQLKKERPRINCLVLAHFLSDVAIRNAINLGALGVLPKSSAVNELREALASIFSGETFVGSNLSALIEREVVGSSQPASSAEPLTLLSNREREIFHMLANGLQNSVIAKKLFISPRTVETHRARIVRKLGVRTNADLIRYAIRAGLAGV